MIICLGTTPAVQRVMVFKKLEIGEVNRAVEVHQGIAGKSVNVAKVLAALNRDVFATGFVGGQRGEYIRAELKRRGIKNNFVTVNNETRLCVTILDQHEGMITELVEESAPVEAVSFANLLKLLAENKQQAKMLLLSGTVPAGGSSSFYRQCIQQMPDVPAIVDAQAKLLLESLAAHPLIAKPNRKELAAALAVITLGTQGAIAFDRHHFWKVKSPAVKAVNSVGSGDAFTAGLASALVDGQPLPEACKLAAACGAANALTLMAGEVRKEDVDRLVSQTTVTRL